MVRSLPRILKNTQVGWGSTLIDCTSSQLFQILMRIEAIMVDFLFPFFPSSTPLWISLYSPQTAISYWLALSEKENFLFIGYLNIFTTDLYSKEEHFLQERNFKVLISTSVWVFHFDNAVLKWNCFTLAIGNGFVLKMPQQYNLVIKGNKGNVAWFWKQQLVKCKSKLSQSQR